MLAEPIIEGETKRSLTQRRAAKLLDVSHFTLNKVLNGKTRSRTLLDRYNELVAEFERGTIRDSQYSDAQISRISLAAWMLNVSTNELHDTLVSVDFDPQLLERFRAFARLTKRPEQFLGLVSTDWDEAETAENQTKPKNEQNEHSSAAETNIGS